MQRQTRRLKTRRRSPETREAPREESVDEAPATDAAPLVVVGSGQASDGERDRSLLEHRGASRGVIRTGQCDQMPPTDAAGLDRDDQPVLARSRTPPFVAELGPAVGRPRSELPVGEELLLEREGHLGGDDLVPEVLQHHRRLESLRELVHDEVGGRAAQHERREALPHLVAGAEGIGLAGDDAAVHRLGDRDELHLAVQDDQREPAFPCRLAHDGRRVAVVRAEFEDDAGGSGIRESRDEGAELRRLGRPRRSGRQQQLAAVEQAGNARAVGDVQPTHARVQCRIADEHFRNALGDRLEREDLAHRGQGRRVGPGCRTIRLDRPIFATFGYHRRIFRSDRLGRTHPIACPVDLSGDPRSCR